MPNNTVQLLSQTEVSNPSSTLGLLTFSRNDVEGVLRTFQTLRSTVDELVVVDSSGESQRSRLRAELRGSQQRIALAPPLGNADLLRPFGLSQMTSDRIIQLDADERLSPALLTELKRLNEADAYVVPRWEAGARGFTYQMRIYRRTSVRFSGPSHGFPEVRGTTKILPRRLCIVHETPAAREYWEQSDRKRRYLLSDTLERPYDTGYLRRTVGFPSSAGKVETTHSAEDRKGQLSPLLIRISLYLEAIRTTLTTGSLGLARLGLAQGQARLQFLDDMSPRHREWLIEVAEQVRQAGGLIQFLGLEDADYLSRLAVLATPEVDGPSLLEFL